MKDLAVLQKARERLSLRRALWFRLMRKDIVINGIDHEEDYRKALTVISDAYDASCKEVDQLEVKSA